MRHSFIKGEKIIMGEREYIIGDRLSNGDLQLQDLVTNEGFAQPEDFLVHQLYEGNLKMLDDSRSYASRKSAAILAADFTQLPDETRAEARRRYDYVKEALKCVDRRTSKAFTPIIQAVATAKKDPEPPSGISVYRWYREFVSTGENVRSLVPRDFDKGRRTDHADSDALSIVDKVITQKYLSLQRLTIQAVYDAVIVEIADTNKFRNVGAKMPIPNYTTVYRRIKKLDPYEVMKARYGKRIADAKFKQLKKAVKPTRPLERVEIDHTKLDLMVIDAERGMPIGRPWLTTAIDVCTKQIFGAFISFTPPSYLSVMQCLLHGIKPKTYVKQKFPAIVNTWEAHGLPETIVVDNGKEFLSTHLEDGCLQLQIVIQQAPIKVPWYKGSVERLFGTINKQLLHLQPGTTFSNIFDKADYDPKKNALIDFKLLDAIWHKWIIDYYHQRPHKGIQNTPARAWRLGVEQFPPALPAKAEDIDVLLGMITERVISPSGIELHGLFYNDDNLSAIKRSNRKMKVKIKYDPTDLSVIYVFDGFKRVFIPVASVNPSYTEGLTLWQHNIIRRFARNELKKNVDVVALARARDEINGMVASYWGKTGKHATRVKLARYMGIGQEKYEIEQMEVESEASDTTIQCDPRKGLIGMSESGQTFVGISDIAGVAECDGESAEGEIIHPENGKESTKKTKVKRGTKTNEPRKKEDVSEKKKQSATSVGVAVEEDDDIDMSGWHAGYNLPK